MYYGRLRTPKVKNTLPQLKDLTKLPIDDLLKVKRFAEDFIAKHEPCKREYEEDKRFNEGINLIIKAMKTEFDCYKEQYERAKKLVDKIEVPLWSLRAGIFSWSSRNYSFRRPEYDTYRGVIYHDYDLQMKKSNETENVIEQHKQAIVGMNTACHKLKASNDEIIQKERSKRSLKISWPKDNTVITVGGSKFEIYFSQINLDDLNSVINARYVEVRKRNETLDELKARASNNETETRRLAERFRRNIHKQLSILDCCPYCAKLLSCDNAHQDHIYPVSKGGQSRLKNLVFICSSCNIRKSDSTLSSFLEQQGYSMTAVYERLKLLQKEF